MSIQFVLTSLAIFAVPSLDSGPLRTELLMKFLDTPEKKNRRLVHLPMGKYLFLLLHVTHLFPPFHVLLPSVGCI